jgi:hypothetical protein
MSVKQLIYTEIDNIPEDQLDELYQLIKNFTAQKNSLKIKRRSPSKAIAGKGKTLGDIVSPIVDEEDWECLK